MAYSKPETANQVLAIEAIQSQGLKVQICALEGPTFPCDATPAAYDADE